MKEAERRRGHFPNCKSVVAAMGADENPPIGAISGYHAEEGGNLARVIDWPLGHSLERREESLRKAQINSDKTDRELRAYRQEILQGSCKDLGVGRRSRTHAI